MKTALYRHFDAAGQLLYVGISLSAIGRLDQHRHGAKWFEYIARVSIEWLPTRSAALAAEAIAIAKEGPLHNTARPKGAARPIPFPSEANEVRCRGEALHPVLWQGKQWAVTEYGIECRDGCYCIPADRLLEKRRGVGGVVTNQDDWPLHMREKEWVDMADFQKAFAVGCWLHRGIPISQERLVPPKLQVWGGA